LAFIHDIGAGFPHFPALIALALPGIFLACIGWKGNFSIKIYIMNKPLLNIAIGCLCLITATSCMVEGGFVETRPVDVTYVRPVSPGVDYVWIDGDWVWGGGRYTWRQGYWSRPRGSRHWESGRWESGAHGYRWNRGHWR